MRALVRAALLAFASLGACAPAFDKQEDQPAAALVALDIIAGAVATPKVATAQPLESILAEVNGSRPMLTAEATIPIVAEYRIDWP